LSDNVLLSSMRKNVAKSPPPQPDKRITFRLESELYSVLRSKAEKLRVSESWLIKDCLYKVLVDSRDSQAMQKETE